MNNALLHNNFNFNFNNQHSNPPAWKCGPFPKDSCNFLDFPVFSVFSFGLNFAQNWLCGGFWSSAGSKACLAGFWGRGGPRGETRRNEENRGGTPGESRRTGRGESRTTHTRKGETRRIEEARPEKRGERAGPGPSLRSPPGPPFNSPRLQVATRPFCFIFGAFLPAWWIFFIFKKSCLQCLCDGHPALSAHRNTKVTKDSSEVAQAGPSSLQHEAKHVIKS